MLPQTTPSSAEFAFQIIRNAILNCELSPGSKISETHTCHIYGIGRGPLRQVFRQLEGYKLVEIKPNAGTKVSYIKPFQSIEIYKIRESLERLVCKLAATNATTTDCLALRSIIAKQRLQMTQNYRDLAPRKKGIWISTFQSLGFLAKHHFSNSYATSFTNFCNCTDCSLTPAPQDHTWPQRNTHISCRYDRKKRFRTS